MLRSLKRLCLVAVLVVMFFCGFLLGSEQMSISDVQTALSQAVSEGLDPENARIYAEKVLSSEKIGPIVNSLKGIMKNILDSICIFLFSMI